MAEEKVFANGFIFKRSEKAPDFVVGSMSIKIDEAIAFMREHDKKGWVNLSVKQARSGNYYIELDTFEPKKSSDTGSKGARDAASEERSASIADDDLPF
jgi:hypothetical protein